MGGLSIPCPTCERQISIPDESGDLTVESSPAPRCIWPHRAVAIAGLIFSGGTFLPMVGWGFVVGSVVAMGFLIYLRTRPDPFPSSRKKSLRLLVAGMGWHYVGIVVICGVMAYAGISYRVVANHSLVRKRRPDPRRTQLDARRAPSKQRKRSGAGVSSDEESSTLSTARKPSLETNSMRSETKGLMRSDKELKKGKLETLCGVTLGSNLLEAQKIVGGTYEGLGAISRVGVSQGGIRVQSDAEPGVWQLTSDTPGWNWIRAWATCNDLGALIYKVSVEKTFEFEPDYDLVSKQLTDRYGPPDSKETIAESVKRLVDNPKEEWPKPPGMYLRWTNGAVRVWAELVYAGEEPESERILAESAALHASAGQEPSLRDSVNALGIIIALAKAPTQQFDVADAQWRLRVNLFDGDLQEKNAAYLHEEMKGKHEAQVQQRLREIHSQEQQRSIRENRLQF